MVLPTAPGIESGGWELGTRRQLLGSAMVTLAATGMVAESQGATSRPPSDTSAAETEQQLRVAFSRLSSTLNGGDVAGFLALFDERAIIIDEDAPFRMSKAEFVDHLSFHGDSNWQGFAWLPRETRFVVRGATGLTAGSVTFRGKPVNAGFRLRHMLHTIGWARSDGAWRIVCFHQTPVWGHVQNPSPGTGG
jgi:hypothetical protein